MQDNNCPFCTRIPQTERITWQDDLWYSFFDNYPVSPGHAIITPKKHIESVKELDDIHWSGLLQAIKSVIELIEHFDLKKLYTQGLENPQNDTSRWYIKNILRHPGLNKKPDAYNHGINDGKCAGRTVDHVHWHVIPRYEADVEDPTGGVRHVIPELGNYKKKRGE